MKYLRIVVYTALVLIAVTFIIQNYPDFSRELIIRLNLYVVNFETAGIQVWVLFLLAFFVGIFLASLLGFVDRLHLKREISSGKREIYRLKEELNSLRNLPLTEQGVPPSFTPHDVEQSER
jgi:lipopolysaccharide assembly protein A